MESSAPLHPALRLPLLDLELSVNQTLALLVALSPFFSILSFFSSHYSANPPSNHHPYRYDDGRGGSKSAIIAPGSDSTTNSYPGHVFCFSERDVASGGCDQRHSLATVTVGPHNYTYLFEDGTASLEGD